MRSLLSVLLLAVLCAGSPAWALIDIIQYAPSVTAAAEVRRENPFNSDILAQDSQTDFDHSQAEVFVELAPTNEVSAGATTTLGGYYDIMGDSATIYFDFEFDYTLKWYSLDPATLEIASVSGYASSAYEFTVTTPVEFSTDGLTSTDTYSTTLSLYNDSFEWWNNANGDVETTLAPGTYYLTITTEFYNVSWSTNQFSELPVSVGEYFSTDAEVSIVSVIPEPRTYALLGGLLALGVVLWRRRS